MSHVAANRIWALSVASILVFVACTNNEKTTTSATGGDGGGGSGGAFTPVLEPGIFDCSANTSPTRVTPIPTSCVTDLACPTPMVSGHRGAGGQIGIIAPENTLSSVRAAIALGIEFIETDPRPTKDGVLVNMHDTSVDRTTDGTGEVANMTLAEVQALKIDPGKFVGDYSCDRVPTIEDVLREAKGKIHVLLDANKTDQIDLLVDAVHKTDTLDWAIFDTDSVDKIDAALALEPQLLTMIRVASMAEFDAEWAHFAAHPPIIVEIHDTAQTAEIAAAVHAKPSHTLTDMFGTDVGAGLANDPSFYGSVFDMGIDIGQSDRPDLVLRHLGRFQGNP
ncbi:MAG TPA: glycerophosphodiester phosphodiesterase family protein [Polyangium sp.]|nr:glycerophosphodiester phosphodiesterase family protein [Polyangium sp.]